MARAMIHEDLSDDCKRILCRPAMRLTRVSASMHAPSTPTWRGALRTTRARAKATRRRMVDRSGFESGHDHGRSVHLGGQAEGRAVRRLGQ
jgi:hypothetical protein